MKTMKCKPVLVAMAINQHSKDNYVLILIIYLQRVKVMMVNLDPNEEIKEGDTFLNNNGLWVHNGKVKPNGKPQKVIAQQSQLSPEYIQQFIEEYNNGDVKDIEIEMIDHKKCNNCGAIYSIDSVHSLCPCCMDSKIISLKLTNGFITIVDRDCNTCIHRIEEPTNYDYCGTCEPKKRGITITNIDKTPQQYLYTGNEIFGTGKNSLDEFLLNSTIYSQEDREVILSALYDYAIQLNKKK